MRTIIKLLGLIDETWCTKKDYYAAVAVVYNPIERKLILLERKEHPGDPWSGHMAFPGGRKEEGDKNSYFTSLRELLEEIQSLDPKEIIHIGGMRTYLSRGIYKIIPHIYLVKNTPELKWDQNEIERAEWVGIDELKEIDCPPEKTPRCFITNKFRKIIWGLTGRVLGDVISILKNDEA
ncbi:MAG: NUDIX hydrolase [Sulfolobales archaeon]